MDFKKTQLGIENKAILIIYIIFFISSLLAIAIILFNNGSYSIGYIELASPITFLNLFKSSCLLVIIMFVATRLDIFKKILSGTNSLKDELLYTIIFGILSILAFTFSSDFYNFTIVIKDFIPLVGGILGGPIIGIGSAIIFGIFRIVEGASGAISLINIITGVISGIVGSVIYYLNKGKTITPLQLGILATLLEGFVCLLILIVPIFSFSNRLELVSSLIFPLMFGNGICALLFALMVNDDIKNYTAIRAWKEKKWK